jgi:hypothetical protein
VKCHTELSVIVSSDNTLFGPFSEGRSDEHFLLTDYRLDLWMKSGEVKNNAFETGNALVRLI